MTDPYMLPVFNYYHAKPEGVTHKFLSRLEHLAEDIGTTLKASLEFAEKRHFKLVNAGYPGDNSACFPLFKATEKSVLGKDIVSIKDLINTHPTAMRLMAGNISWASLPESVQTLMNLYVAPCQTIPGICCEWKSLHTDIQELSIHRNIEQGLVAEARKAAVAITTPAEMARVTLGSNTTLHARAYEAFAHWIYKAPKAPGTKRCFIPPQSDLLTVSELRQLTAGQPLEDFKCDHRQIWSRLNQLERVVTPSWLDLKIG